MQILQIGFRENSVGNFLIFGLSGRELAIFRFWEEIFGGFEMEWRGFSESRATESGDQKGSAEWKFDSSIFEVGAVYSA